jgi:hypothetical protein
MEYTCKNSLKEKETTFQLDTYDIVVISESQKQIIPYPDIIELRLNKKRSLYFLHLHTLTFGTIYITSQSFNQAGGRVDQSRAYLTFARVLHMHLQEKSNAQYFTGFRASKIIAVNGSWAIFASAFFLIEEYFDVLKGNTLIVSLLIFLIGTLLALGMQLNQWPKPYHPTNIPLHMLPTAF